MKKSSYLILSISMFTTDLQGQEYCEVTGPYLNPLISLPAGCGEMIPTENILEFPELIIRVAFHIEGSPGGVNLVCSEDHPLAQEDQRWMATVTVDEMLSRMNSKLKRGLIIDGNPGNDMRIRFEAYGDGECGSGIYLYDYKDTIIDIPGAFNLKLKYLSDKGPENTGSTLPGADYATIYNLLYYYTELNEFNTWGPATSTLHEFGHTKNLKHSFECGNPCNGIDLDADDECCGDCNKPKGECYNCSQQKLIMAYDTSRHYFTECEFQRMWTYMITNPKPYQVYKTPCSGEYVVESNEIWNSTRAYCKDVRVKSGATLEIQCVTYMGADTRIVVEDGAQLIVSEGAQLTKLWEDNWKGIEVYGNGGVYPSGFYAVDIGRATIEYTDNAAVSMYDSGGWLHGEGNARVRINGSKFKNCKRMLEMGTTSTFPDNFNGSIIGGNEQYGGKWGITNWNCEDVHIIGNKFNDIERESVVFVGGDGNISSNTFNSIGTSSYSHVLILHTSIGNGSTVNSNTFLGNRKGIVSAGNTAEWHEIMDNEFYGQYGLYMDGDNSYNVNKNVFKSYIGAFFNNNGITNSNFVERNTFDRTYAGIATVGSNNEFRFNDNCFDSEFTDVNIVGRVSDQYKMEYAEIITANNCFTHRGNLNSSVHDIWGNPDPFTYYEPMDYISNRDKTCLYAIKSHPNVMREYTGGARNNEICEELGHNTTSTPLYTKCQPEASYSAINNARTSLNQDKTEVRTNSNLSTNEKDILIDGINGCIRNVRRTWMKLKLKDGLYAEVRDTLRKYSSDDDKLAYYSTFIMEGNLDSAEQYLQTFSNPSIELSDFKDVQEIYLEKLNDEVYSPSGQELEIVRRVAEKEHPYAAYGKSVYYAFTGELILSDEPVFDEPVQERSMGIVEYDVVKVYPNPFDSELILEFDVDGAVNVLITNSKGEIILQNDYVEKSTISTIDWTPGVYYVLVKSGREVLYQDKMILVR